MVEINSKEFISLLKSHTAQGIHPRLYAGEEDFARIRVLLETDDNMKRWYLFHKRAADYSLKLPPFEREIRDGLRLLHVSQDVTSRLYSLALVYRIEKDSRYAERIYDEFLCLSEYEDWNSSHFLDLAQMTYAVTLAYDWTYDYLTDDRKKLVKDMLVEKSYKPYRMAYDNFASGRELRSGIDIGSWSRSVGNWNWWCNGAAVALAIVLGDENDDMGYIAEQALSSLTNAMEAYAPDGGFVEGISYGMATNSFWAHLTQSLITALGDDLSLLSTKGIMNFAYFVLYMTGPVTGFNFHDAGGNDRYIYENGFFVANQKQEPMLGENRIKDICSCRAHASIFDIIWYQPGKYTHSDKTLEKDRYFRKVESGSFRSGWDKDDIWFAFHGGENDVAHSHLDSGSFVLDAKGENWALDLGTEPLTYFGKSEEVGNPYLLYRIAPDGHNTLVINPSETKEAQAIPSFSPVTEFVSSKDAAYAVMDLTAAYTKQADGNVWDMHSKRIGIPRSYYESKVKTLYRGFALCDNRNKVVIQDEIDLINPSEIYWSMHTRADIEISPDKKRAVLTQQNKKIYVSLCVEGSENYELLKLKAEPLENGPKNEFQKKNDGINKLCAYVEGKSMTTIRIEITFEEDAENVVKDKILPLNEWSKKIRLSGGKL